MINNMHKSYMARPKPLAQGELLTHRDEINNHKHCNENHKIDSNSLTMSPIGEEIYYYKWWNMAMEMEKGLEIWRWLVICGRDFFARSGLFSRRPRLLYIGVPSQKLFCLT